MSYGLKYTVPFKTISEVDCVVNIEEKDFIGQPVELLAGAAPFTIDTDTGDLLTPVRGSGATLQVFGSDYLQDLYTSDPHGVKVTLFVGGVVKWLGYMIPDTFSQDFSNINFIFEIECVSALSTLKNKPFDLTTDTASFIALIKRARDLAGYSEIYLTSTIRGAGGQNIYEAAEVASANFYDELGEAMTYYEILGEIAKYLGCAFTASGSGLYLIDPFAVKQGLNSYYKYLGDVHTETTLADPKVISGSDYTGTGAKLNRISGKNKVTINCSLYEVENLLPDIETGLGLGIGRTNTSWQKQSGDPTHTLVTVPAVYSAEHDEVETYYYGADLPHSLLTKVVRYTSDNVPNKLNFDTELRLRYYYTKATHDAGVYLTDTDPVMKITSGGSIYVHKGVYFAFYADLMANMAGTTASSGYDWPETVDTGLIMVEPWQPAAVDTIWLIRLKLRVGNYYYNGSTWDTIDATFFAQFEIKKDEKKYGRYIAIKDTNDYTLGIGDLSGCIINPPPATIFGDLELTIYAPRPTDFNFPAGSAYSVKYAFLKNIKLDYAIQDLTGVYDFTKKDREDVIYESDDTGTYVEKADEIDLRICTNVDGKLALSSVMEDNDFLQTISIGSLGYSILPEEGLINKAVQLYSKPRYNVTPILVNTLKPYSLVTDPYLPGSTFIVAGGEEDIKLGSCTYNLIEI